MQIREKLQEAAQTSASDWHVLFTDCDTTRVHRAHSGGSLNRHGDIISQSHHGVSLNRLNNNQCACLPYIYHLTRHHANAQNDLLDEIDACHHELSAELKCVD